jgi:hypothetical protein
MILEGLIRLSLVAGSCNDPQHLVPSDSQPGGMGAKSLPP